MKDRNLAVITKWFPSEGTSLSSPFVYYITKEVSKHFKKVYVFSLNSRIPKILRKKAFLTRIGYDKRWHNDIYSEKYMTPYSFENIDVSYVSYSDIVSRISFDIEVRRAYRRIISDIESRKLKIDLIHAHFLFPTGYLSAMIKEEFGIPLVVSGHGSDVYSLPFKNRKFLSAIKWTVEKADHIITPSERNRKILENELGAASERVSVIPNGYDEGLFYPMNKKEARKKLGLDSEKNIMISVGNLIPVKGYDILIEAVAHIKRKMGDDIQLIIIGDGPMRNTLEEKIRKLRLQKNVLITGNLPHEEIPMWINASDIFVISSRDEGNPTVMFEAWGCGRPVVSTAVGGIPDVFQNGMGLMVGPENPSSLAEGIEKALSMEWNAMQISENARQFSWKNVAKRTYSVYRKYININ